MFFFDPTFIIILPALFFSLYASAKLRSVYSQYGKMFCRSGITGAQAARRVLDGKGLYNVKIECVSGELTDHYDPRDNTVRLSEGVYNSSSAAAVGVACHEVGHAIQYSESYAPIKLRSAIVPLTNIGSKIGLWMFFIGVIFSYSSEFFYNVALWGIALFSLTAVFQLITLPTEFNASRRAMNEIEVCGILTEDEQVGAKKVLSAAALTYVAGLSVTILQIVRLLAILGGPRRRD